MKKKTNFNLFPYMSIVVIDDLQKVQVCCEALIVSERHDGYSYMLNSAFNMAPKVSRKNIKCVYGDEFITQTILDNSQLSHVSLFYDHYHLDLNFQKKLGSLYPQAKSFLCSLLNSDSELIFNNTMKSMMSHFESETKILELANELKEKKPFCSI